VFILLLRGKHAAHIYICINSALSSVGGFGMFANSILLLYNFFLPLSAEWNPQKKTSLNLKLINNELNEWINNLLDNLLHNYSKSPHLDVCECN